MLNSTVRVLSDKGVTFQGVIIQLSQIPVQSLARAERRVVTTCANAIREGEMACDDVREASKAFRDCGQRDYAILAMQIGQRIAIELQNRDELGYFYSQLVKTCLHFGEATLAVEFARRFASNFNGSDNDASVARNQLVGALLANGQRDEALAQVQQNVTEFGGDIDSAYNANIAKNQLVEVLLANGQRDAALAQVLQNVSEFDEDSREGRSARNQLVEVLLASGRRRKALVQVAQNVADFDIDSRDGRIARCLLVEALLANGQPGNALAQALQNVNNFGEERDEMGCRNQLVIVFLANGIADRALQLAQRNERDFGQAGKSGRIARTQLAMAWLANGEYRTASAQARRNVESFGANTRDGKIAQILLDKCEGFVCRQGQPQAGSNQGDLWDETRKFVEGIVRTRWTSRFWEQGVYNFISRNRTAGMVAGNGQGPTP